MHLLERSAHRVGSGYPCWVGCDSNSVNLGIFRLEIKRTLETNNCRATANHWQRFSRSLGEFYPKVNRLMKVNKQLNFIMNW